MQADGYFSERVDGVEPRDVQEISGRAWAGLLSYIISLRDKGAFGADFPNTCADGAIIGTHAYHWIKAAQAEILGLPDYLPDTDLPDTLVILDFVQFCHRVVAEPIQGPYHDFCRNYHLTFDREKGQLDFRNTINRIFRRNGLAYQLEDTGVITHLAPLGLSELMAESDVGTGDSGLDLILKSARNKIANKNIDVRVEGLQKLWDGWERLKTLEDEDKKKGIAKLLQKAASEEHILEHLEVEAAELTRIGNEFCIRHSEKTQTPIEKSEIIDYLFHRCYSMIILLLRSR